MAHQIQRSVGFQGLGFLAMTALGACASPPPADEEPPLCTDACFIDRDCGENRVCDKTNDGDDVGAADDDEGCCIDIEGACDSDDDCSGDDVCRVQFGRFLVCGPLD